MDELIVEPIQMSTGLYERLVRLALDNNTSVSEIVKRAVEHYTEVPTEPTSVYDWRDRMEAMRTKRGGSK